MRRLLCATALSGALLLLGACSADSPPTTDAAAPTAASASVAGPSSAAATTATSAPAKGKSGDAALKNDTDAICTQAQKTGGEAARTFAADVKLLIDAESAKDTNAVAQAKEKTTRDVQNYSYALRDMSKLASDKALKKALSDMGEQVSALDGDVRKLDADKLAKLQDTLAKACGTE